MRFQKGCAICGREDMKLVQDHDHNNGMLRGLLCGNCNTGIGMLGDDPHRLRHAIEYIEQWRREPSCIPWHPRATEKRRQKRKLEEVPAREPSGWPQALLRSKSDEADAQNVQ